MVYLDIGDSGVHDTSFKINLNIKDWNMQQS